jgi:hypothetical protein
MGRYCDIAHVIAPDAGSRIGDRLSGVDAGTALVHLDLEVKPATMSHLLAPGEYRLVLKVAAANVRPFKKALRLVHTGLWFDAEKEMFKQGTYFFDDEP